MGHSLPMNSWGKSCGGTGDIDGTGQFDESYSWEKSY